jgi:DNA-binding transcriptional ArsR family regulator
MPQAIDWEKLARTYVHPIALEIIEMYAGLDDGEKLAPHEVAQQLGHPLGNVSYHVRKLLEAKLLKRAGTAQRRGAVVHFYRLR